MPFMSRKVYPMFFPKDFFKGMVIGDWRYFFTSLFTLKYLTCVPYVGAALFAIGMIENFGDIEKSISSVKEKFWVTISSNFIFWNIALCFILLCVPALY